MVKNDRGNFSEGKISKHLVKLALPIMLAEFVHVLYNIVDRMYIGRIEGTGTLALSGVGIVFPLISFLNAFAGLCGKGGAPLCSISRGKGDDEQARKIMETSLSFLIVIGIVISVALSFLLDWLLPLVGSDEETFVFAKDYFSIYLFGTVFVLISLGMNPFINMQGNSITGMFTVLIGAVVNVILDPIMIFVLDMGVRGAAVATVISQFLSALWVVLFLSSKRSKIRIRHFGINFRILLDVMKLGITGFIFKVTNSITQAVANITLRLFGGPLGTLYIGAMSIINSVREICQLPTGSFIDSAQPIMGYNYGARKYSRVRETIRKAGLCGLILNGGLWVAIQFATSSVIGIFTPDSQLVEAAVPCMRIYFVAFLFMVGQMIGQNTFIALNCPKRAVFFSLFRKVILVLPLTLILPRTSIGVMGVFWAEAISQCVGGLCSFSGMLLTVYRKLRRTPDGAELTV